MAGLLQELENGVHTGNVRSMESAKHLFRPLASRARLVTIFFRCYVAALAVVILAEAIASMNGVDLHPHNAVEDPLQAAMVLLWGIAQILYAIFLITCMLVFLMWLYRARSNLPALGVTDVRWSPGWSIGWWFIPIISLFRPYQLVKETWQASDPTSLSGWSREPPPGIFGWWWALYLVSNLGISATSYARIGGTPSSDTATFIHWVAQIICIGSALCAIRI